MLQIIISRTFCVTFHHSFGVPKTCQQYEKTEPPHVFTTLKQLLKAHKRKCKGRIKPSNENYRFFYYSDKSLWTSHLNNSNVCCCSLIGKKSKLTRVNCIHQSITIYGGSDVNYSTLELYVEKPSGMRMFRGNSWNALFTIFFYLSGAFNLTWYERSFCFEAHFRELILDIY